MMTTGLLVLPETLVLSVPSDSETVQTRHLPVTPACVTHATFAKALPESMKMLVTYLVFVYLAAQF